MDRAPPPPYSETDIYSNSGSGTHPIPTPASTSVDNASVTGPSFSDDSSVDSIVHTPPYSPDGSLHNGEGRDHVSSPSAAAFFESRSPLQLSSDTLIIHTITILENTKPSDLPFPHPEEKWLERGVLPEDWQTFINYLIPYHADISNSEVANRKLEAEAINERIKNLTLDTDGMSINTEKVDAQLSPLRQTHTDPRAAPTVDAIIREWNERFFGPRGLLVEITEPATQTRTMPGSWTEDPGEVHPESMSGGRGARGGRRGFPEGFGGGWIRADNTGFHIGRGLLSADHNGFRLGGNALVADNNGFRIGNMLVADGNGFKLGPLKADSSGVRFGRRGIGPGRGGARGPFRGRCPESQPSPIHRQRDRSRSVSSSSSSSSTSVESTGSLPDWDRLNDAQLPVMKQSVTEWLSNPEWPITKEAVNNIKKEVKAAKAAARSAAASQQNSDTKALRQEVRGMLREFKELQRTQKRTKRAARRERHALRKMARKQEKMTKKLERKMAKMGKRREEPPHEWGGPMRPVSAMPAVAALHTSSGHGAEAWPQVPPPDSAGWPFMETSQGGADTVRVAQLQTEGRRIGAEAWASQQRQWAEIQAQASRRQAEAIKRQAVASAAVARRKAEAGRVRSQAMRMLAEVQRMRAKAASLQDEKARLELLGVAAQLDEEVEKMRLEGERLMAEAMQLGVDAERELQDRDGDPDPPRPQRQESGVVQNGS